jgi:cytochrome c oxidase cbb3-type subunit 3
MPTKIEKDSITGTDTTGHEWDGIKELNTPLPKWWLYVFYATVIWAAIYVVLFPAIPFINGHTDGVLGFSQRERVVEQVEAAKARQAEYLTGIQNASLEEITANPDLLNFAVVGGSAAFASNCAPCHAQGGAGQAGGYPTLADDVWLWGGSLEEIHTTLLHGIRWDQDPDTRFSEMPAFGQILEPGQIEQVANYVVSLSGAEADASLAAEGETIYLEQCAACHMEDGSGGRDFGAPRLNDQVWLYGGTVDAVTNQVSNPKHGVMPAWQGRLDETTIKMLTVYVHSLGGGE